MHTSTISTSTWPQSTSLTMAMIERMVSIMEEGERENRRQSMANMAAGLFNPFGALRVVESPLTQREVPIKVHKRRRNHSARYHARIQKKWLKRYGMKPEICAYVLDGGAYGLGSTLVLHPKHAAMLRMSVPNDPANFSPTAAP
jgi:hypothetical protein